MSNLQHHIFNTLTPQDEVMTIWVLITNGDRIRILEITDSINPPREIHITGLEYTSVYSPMNSLTVMAGDQASLQWQNILTSTNPVTPHVRQTISAYLEKAQNDGLFDQLIVVAPDDILGVFKDRLTDKVRKLMMLELETDLIDADEAAIRACLPV